MAGFDSVKDLAELATVPSRVPVVKGSQVDPLHFLIWKSLVVPLKVQLKLTLIGLQLTVPERTGAGAGAGVLVAAGAGVLVAAGAGVLVGVATITQQPCL